MQTISSFQMVLMLAYPKELIIVSSTINCSFWRVKHVFFLADLGKLSNLERLDCRHNQLTSVPRLSSCQSLKVRVILTALPSTHKNTIIQRFKKTFSQACVHVADGFFWVCFSFVVRTVRDKAARYLDRNQARKRM